MNHPTDVASVLDATARLCRTVDVEGWAAEDFDIVLRSLGTIAYEVVGLSARIRAAKVNNTPVVHPVKPAPKPQPKADPPPTQPPPDDGAKR